MTTEATRNEDFVTLDPRQPETPSEAMSQIADRAVREAAPRGSGTLSPELNELIRDRVDSRMRAWTGANQDENFYSMIRRILESEVGTFVSNYDSSCNWGQSVHNLVRAAVYEYVRTNDDFVVLIAERLAEMEARDPLPTATAEFGSNMVMVSQDTVRETEALPTADMPTPQPVERPRFRSTFAVTAKATYHPGVFDEPLRAAGLFRTACEQIGRGWTGAYVSDGVWRINDLDQNTLRELAANGGQTIVNAGDVTFEFQV